MTSDKAPFEPLFIDVATACRILSISRSKFYEARAAGQFAPAVLRISRKLLIRRQELEAWIEAGLPPRRAWVWRATK
jgi:predicted DNA-binding transcriptional regulator AlpA